VPTTADERHLPDLVIAFGHQDAGTDGRHGDGAGLAGHHPVLQAIDRGRAAFLQRRQRRLRHGVDGWRRGVDAGRRVDSRGVVIAATAAGRVHRRVDAGPTRSGLYAAGSVGATAALIAAGSFIGAAAGSIRRSAGAFHRRHDDDLVLRLLAGAAEHGRRQQKAAQHDAQSIRKKGLAVQVGPPFAAPRNMRGSIHVRATGDRDFGAAERHKAAARRRSSPSEI
jgi:hypothetical protein